MRQKTWKRKEKISINNQTYANMKKKLTLTYV